MRLRTVLLIILVIAFSAISVLLFCNGHYTLGGVAVVFLAVISAVCYAEYFRNLRKLIFMLDAFEANDFMVRLQEIGSGRDKLFGIILCLYAGLRIGELLALTWADMDLRKGLISVTKSCHDSKDGRVVEEPKTLSSRRIIPLPKQLLPLLKGLKKRSTSPFVISSNGKPVFVRSYQRTFELLLIKLRIPHKGFHSLRHTFATRALECGMDVKTLSEILGHKNPTVTLNRYAHSLMEHKADMMNRLGKLL